MSDYQVVTALDAGGNSGAVGNPALNKQRQTVVMDFWQAMAMMGAGYQIRAGTITTPIIGGVPLADTAAEMCVDAIAGAMILPVYQNITVRLGTGTLHEYATKSVNVVSSAGTAFVPLPLRNLGSGGATADTAASKGVSARVQAAGAVTVTAELATTTRRHWNFSNPLAVGAGHEQTVHEWAPRMAPPLSGPVCLYTQVNATGTGPSFYALLDFIIVPPSAFF